MLFKLDKDFTSIEPVGFEDFAASSELEKKLEDLLADNLCHSLLGDTPLLPFFQERRRQPECDIYALNEEGDLVLFELKRSTASGDALDQLLRYTQNAGQWTYATINDMFQRYDKNEQKGVELAIVHAEALGISHPLQPEVFNRRQRMFVVGSAADQKLMAGVDYWKRQGLAIDFVPYRVFDIGGEKYFEFFSKPYDVHINPNDVKGIMFDTCQSYYPMNLQWMMEKRRISSFGSSKDAVRSFNRGDYVFYSQTGEGIIAAARITGSQVMSDVEPGGGEEEFYWNVTFETPVLTEFDSFPCKLSFSDVKRILGKNFYWASTRKTPYLTREEAELLLAELQKRFTSPTAEQ